MDFRPSNDIYYYQFFDPDRDQFGNISVFQLDKANFTVTRRIHADRARWSENLNRWEYERGWDAYVECLGHLRLPLV